MTHAIALAVLAWLGPGAMSDCSSLQVWSYMYTTARPACEDRVPGARFMVLFLDIACPPIVTHNYPYCKFPVFPKPRASAMKIACLTSEEASNGEMSPNEDDDSDDDGVALEPHIALPAAFH